jgi:uncharacterized protein DUF6487
MQENLTQQSIAKGPEKATDEQPHPVLQCPLCQGPMEIGCLMGKDSMFGFQWYKGEPTFWKNAFPHGESVGENALPYGTHMTGMRCEKCRKMVLDY